MPLTITCWMCAEPLPSHLRIMGIYGRALAISIGVLTGGGLGFYWRETYVLKTSQLKRSELEEQLNVLIKSRREKENTLQNKR